MNRNGRLTWNNRDDTACECPAHKVPWMTAAKNWERRAAKAEQERDKWRKIASDAEKDADEAEENLLAFKAAQAFSDPRPLTADDITDEMVERARVAYPASDRACLYRALIAALTEPTRPEWLDAPAVRAWHKDDGRTECDGTPGKPRIWSPEYGTTERWSTPSLREVHWSDLVDVEALDVTAELAEAADRAVAFMSGRVTGAES